MSRVSTVRRWVRHSGMRPVASVLGGYVAMRTLGTGIRRYTAPSIMDFTRSGGKLTTSAPGFLRELGWETTEIERVLGEYQEVTEELTARYADTALCYPGLTAWKRRPARCCTD